MKKERLILLLILLLMGLFLLSPPIASTYAEATGEVTVGSVTARPGKIKEITITVKDLPTAVADFQGTLKFDPWVVNAQELVEVNNYAIFASNIDNLEGKVRFVIVNYQGTAKKSGAILEIKLLAVGDFTTHNESPLTLELKSFNDADGNSLTPAITNGTFEIKNQPPVADFSFSPTKPKVGQTVTFTDSSNDPDGEDGEIASWKWEFGDGATSTERNPTHQYSQSGKFTVKLTVTDSDSATNSKSKEITIGTQPPVADFTFVPPLPNVNQTVQFTDQSTDPDGSITAWSWDFGDGGTSSEQNPTHQYSAKGKYTVELTVTDNSGLTNAKSETVLIGLKPPVANFSFFPASPKAGKMVRFVDQSSDPDGKIQSWSWDFGDGSPTSTDKKPKHVYAEEGTYTVKLTVTDDDDLPATVTKEITVGAGRPVVLVHCFPNPASTETTFKYDLPDGTDKATLYVFDITGKLAFQHELTVTATEYTWDLKSDDVELPNGPYFYYIIARDADGKFIARSAIGRLVIQRS